MRYTIFALLFSLPFWAEAQLHESVLPELEGNELLETLQDEYRPTNVLPYSLVRDTMFRNIDSRNDTLYGVYTNFAVYLPPNEDATEAAFQAGINTEHSYPRSKGAGSFVPESDMHHLFPTRVDVNADRASFPFAEVPDNDAIRWYYESQQFMSQPSSDTGQFSELGQMSFEPPEGFKGNIARAIFYFYTMYKQEADGEDPNFFEEQRATLCQWQAQDPVDQHEWDRTKAIAEYQEGKANPFVLDCTLATRCYCEGEVAPCMPPVSSQEQHTLRLVLNAFPVPAVSSVTLQYELPAAGQSTLAIHNAIGQVVKRIDLDHQPAGRQQQILHLPRAAGQYTCILQWEGTNGSRATGQVMVLKQ